MSSSGIATRSTGRRRIDSSPSSVNDPLWPTSSPGSSRISVPALCTSIGPSGGVQAAQPAAVDAQARRRPRRAARRARPAPRRRRAWRACRRSRRSRVTSVVPSQTAPISSERCEIDLSPGTAISPTSAAAGAIVRGGRIRSRRSRRIRQHGRRERAVALRVEQLDGALGGVAGRPRAARSCRRARA